MQNEKVIVIDFGGQYNQLVARRVRECQVYCEIVSWRTPMEKIREMNPKGIILTGGPNSVYEDGAALCGKELFELGIPVLGLCYGAQLMMHVLGGKVERAEQREYGRTKTYYQRDSRLFAGIPEGSSGGHRVEEKADTAAGGMSSETGEMQVWMSHFDFISGMAPGFQTVAWTDNCPVAAA